MLGKISLSIAVTICLALRPIHSTAPKRGLLYSSCTGNGRLEFAALTGGVMYWDRRDAGLQNTSESGLMNNTNIIDCVIVFKGKPQGENNGYKQLLTFHWRRWTFDPTALLRAAEAQDYLNDTLQQIQAVCGPNCPTGCLIFNDPSSGEQTIYCGKDKLQGTDHEPTYEQDTITWNLYVLGGFYEMVNDTLEARVPAPNIRIIVDYTSFFAGPCYETSHYQCPQTGRCIDKDLKCDSLSAVNCGVPKSGTKGDFIGCAASTTTEPWVIALAVLAGLIALFWICMWCFWRPGYLLWRCARLRNCVCTSAACNKCCREPCTHGACSSVACCSVGPISSAGGGCCGSGGGGGGCCGGGGGGGGCCGGGCCGGGCCGGGGGEGGGSGGGGGGGNGGRGGDPDDDSWDEYDNGGFKGEYDPEFAWTKWCYDDGMHLREGR